MTRASSPATQLRSELNKQSAWPLDIIEYSLVSARSGDGSSQGGFVEYLRAVFGPNPPDLIIGIGAPAGGFVQQHREQLFKSTPLLITAIEERRVEHSKLTENDTVVAVHHDFRVLFENILRVLPDTKNIVAVNGVSPNERFWKEEIARETEPLQSRVTITWSDDLPFEDVLKHAAKLPPNSAIFLFQMQIDSAGVVHEGDTPLRRLYAVANAPIFSTDEAFFGRELGGGPMHSVAVNNERAVAVAVRLLGGESAANIKLPPSNFAPPKFDWRELQRWHISESSLPPGSEVHFRVPTVWDQYRWQTILVMALFLAQAGIIARLFYEQRRRRKAEIESRQRMSELAHMNRYATAGELSASIAHELNQPLGAILNNAEVAEILLNARSTNLDDIKVVIAEIKRDAQRASEVIKRLRRLLTKTEVQIQDIDLNETIQEVFEFLSVQARSRDVVLSIALSPETVRVKGDRIQLQQVILNLVVNAMDAMAGGRTPERKIIGMTMLVDGSAQLSIADCGPGIPSDKIPHLFEPFFTTKQHGMGMGLSIARTIVEAHGGRIWAENHTGGGAIFQLSLPLAEAR